MAHTVKIQEIINGVQITETIDGNVVEKLISYQSKPFLRTTNESAEETYQVLDIVGEIYNTPALATDFRIIDKNDNVFIPANGVELIAYSLKIRAFRPDADINEVLTIGAITTTTNSVTIGLHSSGTNAVRIDGLTYEKYYPDLFNFTPVTTGQKILIIHALPDAQVFHLAQGAESTEAVEPAYSGLFVARLLVTDEGIDIVEAVSGFREKSVDNFVIYSLVSGDRILGIGSQMRLKVQSSGAIRIGGFYNEEDKIYNGCPISVRNDTPFPMEFYNAVDSSPEFMPINPDDLPFSIKHGETANFAWRGNVAEIIKTGGGGAELPPGTDGQIYEIDNSLPEKIKPSDRLTTAENEIDAEIVNRALADNALQSQITTEKNRNDTQDGQIASEAIKRIEITTTTSISTNTLGTVTGKGQHGRHTQIKNGVHAINIECRTDSAADFMSSGEHLGSADITFVAGSGATVTDVYGGNKVLKANGTYTITRNANNYNLRISNP